MIENILYLLASKVFIMIEIINYILFSIAWCKLCNKANIKNQWLAFIPFLQIIIFLNIIDRSGFYALLLVIPLVNAILMIIWFTEFYSCFNIRKLWIGVSIAVYPIGCVYMLYMSYSKHIEYVGNSRFSEH